MANYILFTVFLSGMVTLGVELSASRLIEPFFGNSLLVWSSLIGFVLSALSIGYYWGGKLADRKPEASLLFKLLIGGGAFIGITPWLMRRALLISTFGFDTGSMVWFILPLLVSLVVVCLPMVLLGMVSPFAIKLLTPDAAHAGAYAGKVFALGTLGSIVGAFLPVLLLIPAIGTRASFGLFSLSLILCGVAGLLLFAKSPLGIQGAIASLGGIAAITFASGNLPLRPNENLIVERETAYNYIQVVDQPGARTLRLSDGRGVHSIYIPERVLIQSYWDFFLVAPYFAPAPVQEKDVKNFLMIGAAAGTSSRQFTEVYGPIPITGVEIDPEISLIGKEYFDMTQENLSTVNMDGRSYLRTTTDTFSVIGLDAYRPPYIPFHLTTQEFFAALKTKLKPRGVIVLNAWRTPTDYRLVMAIASTMKSVFPSVYAIDTSLGGLFENTLLVAVAEDTTHEDLFQNLAQLTNPLLLETSAYLRNYSIWEIRCEEDRPIVPMLNEPSPHLPTECSEPFTDDWAPIEKVTHGVIYSLLKGN